MSPVLNSNKNLWDKFKSAIGKKNPANVQELEQTANEEWGKILSEKCKKLIDGSKKCLGISQIIGMPLLLPLLLIQFLL